MIFVTYCLLKCRAKVMDFNLMTNDKGATVYAFTLRMRATGTLEWPLTQVS